MKNFFLVFMILFVSCGKDFLTENPKGILTVDLALSSGDIQSVADGLAYQFSNIYSQSACVAPYMGGDDLTSFQCCRISFEEIDRFRTSASNQRLFVYWSSCYLTIRNANAIIDHIDKNKENQSLRNDVKGQAYFYRGLCYSFLTRIFGKVPLITEFLSNSDFSIPKAEVSDIYEQIVSDLKNAEELLPKIRPEKSDERGGNPGAKPCQGTVKALLSQIYLTMAGWPLNQKDNYALAAAKAKEVIDNSHVYGYQLLSDPHDLWTWANNYTNKEIVFGVYFSMIHQSMHGPLGPRPIEDFLGGWASGWNDYMGEISFFKRFPAGPRKDATYQTIMDKDNFGKVSWDDPRTSTRHPYFKKYQEEYPGAVWIGCRTEQVIRYAEILLNYAEAQVMSTGIADDSAYAAVNQIRKRAGLPNITPGLSAIAFRDSVLAERGWEFAGGEAASRWFDLIRTESLEQATLLRSIQEQPLYKQPDHQDYWLPIPSVDALANPLLNN